MGSIWEKKSVIALSSHDYALFQQVPVWKKKKKCKCIHHKSMSLGSGNQGKKRRRSWMAGLPVSNSQFKS